MCLIDKKNKYFVVTCVGEVWLKKMQQLLSDGKNSVEGGHLQLG